MSLICFDVDGTLLDNASKIISPMTINTIKKLQKHHKVIISTGRCFESVRATGLLDMIQWDGLVLNNGQYVLDFSYQPIYTEYLNTESFLKIKSLCEKKGFNLSIINGKEWYLVNKRDALVEITHTFFGEKVPVEGDYHGENVIMALMYAPMDTDYTEFYSIENLHVIPGVAPYADICAKESSKYLGILKLLEHLGINDYIAFGDANNDLEMIEHAKIGIAMGQGTDELKAIADYITLACSDDGITYACQQLNLID